MLTPEWVYGVRTVDARSNVHWTAGGEIIFHAALAVVYDPATHAQRFFTAHTDDVLCAAVPQAAARRHRRRASRRSPASGTRAPRRHSPCCVVPIGSASVRLPSMRAMHSSHRPRALTQRCSWDWARGALVGRVACGPARLFALAFRPPAATDGAPAIELAACGVRALHFVSSGDTDAAAGGAPAFRCRRGAWGAKSAPCSLLCVTYLPGGDGGGECVTGSVRGELLLWRDRQLLRVVAAHSGPVFTLALATAAEARRRRRC